MVGRARGWFHLDVDPSGQHHRFVLDVEKGGHHAGGCG